MANLTEFKIQQGHISTLKIADPYLLAAKAGVLNELHQILNLSLKFHETHFIPITSVNDSTVQQV